MLRLLKNKNRDYTTFAFENWFFSGDILPFFGEDFPADPFEMDDISMSPDSGRAQDGNLSDQRW